MELGGYGPKWVALLIAAGGIFYKITRFASQQESQMDELKEDHKELTKSVGDLKQQALTRVEHDRIQDVCKNELNSKILSTDSKVKAIMDRFDAADKKRDHAREVDTDKLQKLEVSIGKLDTTVGHVAEMLERHVELDALKTKQRSA